MINKLVTYISNPTFAHIVVNNKSFNIGNKHRLFSRIIDAAEYARSTDRVEDAQYLLDLLTPGRYLAAISNGYVESDPISGRVFIKGTDEVLPTLLGERMLNAIAAGQDITHLINFWKNAMLNPNPVARNDLYWFLEKEGHPITQEGLFVAYKKVVKTENEVLPYDEQAKKSHLTTSTLREYVLDAIKRIKDDNLNGNNFSVYVSKTEGYVLIDNTTTIVPQQYVHLGSLVDIYNGINNENFDGYVAFLAGLVNNAADKTFTDSHSRTFKIELGSPVRMEREDCDSNPMQTCSKGLHLGSYRYAKSFGGDTLLLCVCNPRDVVAVPKDYNGEKLRCCEYLPLSIVTEIVDDNMVSVQEMLSAYSLNNTSYTPELPLGDEEEEDYDDGNEVTEEVDYTQITRYDYSYEEWLEYLIELLEENQELQILDRIKTDVITKELLTIKYHDEMDVDSMYEYLADLV